MKTEFKPAKMVNWFHPSVLAQSGIKSAVSKMFGNYADRRETQAALDDPEAKDAWEKRTDQYLENNEIWVDFISDTGDGFNPTYSVASLAAQDELNITCKGKAYILPRAKILVLGGDQIYPTPTSELYHNNFRIPFESALPARDDDPGHPDMYAIPGNHDWYDGLGNFMKVFCQQRWIGNWKTQQLRSYFAIPLPNNYWLWATDIQLNEDIDKPQQDYFRMIASDKMKQDDKVILCTAEPSWVYKEMYPADSSYERLQFFIDTYITKEGAACPGKNFQLAAVLTGDLHHYTHYCLPEEAHKNTIATAAADIRDQQEGRTHGKFSYHYIGAGGGGAFLHLTHNLPKKLLKLKGKPVEMKASFPDDKQSRSLLSGNFAFMKHNFRFSFLIGCVYLLFFWLMSSHFNTDPMSYISKTQDSFTAQDNLITQQNRIPDPDQRKHVSLTAYIKGMNFSRYCLFTGLELVKNPLVLLLSVLIIWGFTTFADTKTGRKYICWWGFLHGLLQFVSIFLLLYLFVQVIPSISLFTNFWFDPAVAPALLIAGTITGGSLMGLYLILSDLIFRIHIDESSSSLICQDYKNFLRMHIAEDALTIYPIGIRKVTKKWSISPEDQNKNFRISGQLPAYHLIEEPIVIKLN